MANFDAIILAAGTSTRMGAVNKLLLEVDSQPMVRKVVQTYLDAIDGHVTVVTGFDSEKIRAALGGLNVSICQNPAFESGQQSSVAMGLSQSLAAQAILIGLGDQPLLRAEDLSDLMAAHTLADEGKITIPTHKGKRGNPIVLPNPLRPRLFENPNKPGCMRFTRDHPECCQMLPLPGPGFYADIDTPAEYAAYQTHAKGDFNEMAH